jgi:hypothetical protein
LSDAFCGSEFAEASMLGETWNLRAIEAIVSPLRAA